MPRIRPGQKPVNKPAPVSKELHKFELDNVLYDIEQMENELPYKMVAFAKNYAQGSMSIKQCAAEAGYSPRSVKQRGTQLVQHSTVKTLIAAYKRADMLQNGMPLSWKRQHLKRIVQSDKAPEAAQISALRLLSELDGDLKPDLNISPVINVALNLGESSGEIYEHETGTLRGGATRGLPAEELDKIK